MTVPSVTRRPIAVRNTSWAHAIARFLARAGAKPNAISVFSVLCAAVACLFFAYTNGSSAASAPWLFIGGAIAVQARLLCNLFDGMVAVECGLKTKSGEIYNELPDRLADVLIILGLAYSLGVQEYGVILGWAAALLAVLTAYVRALGASAGAGHEFCGPMAKQQRMFIVTFAAVVAAIEVWWQLPHRAVMVALGLIVIGSIATCCRRTARIVRTLENK